MNSFDLTYNNDTNNAKSLTKKVKAKYKHFRRLIGRQKDRQNTTHIIPSILVSVKNHAYDKLSAYLLLQYPHA